MPRRGFTRIECVVVVLVIAVVIGILLPAVERVRDPAAWMQARNHLKEIGLAAAQDLTVNGRYIRPIATDSGEALLSWRVRLLPHLEQEALAARFDAKAAWDAQPNVAAGTMPRVFWHPKQEVGAVVTHFRAFDGVALVINGRPSPSVYAVPGGATLKQLRDGTSNTLLVAESAVSVEWARPVEMPVRPGGALPALGGLLRNAAVVLFADGSVTTVPPSELRPETLRALIGIDDGRAVEVP